MPDQTLNQAALLATKNAFDSARRALGDDEIIGYAILTHDTADSCQPVFATDRGAESFRVGSRHEFLFSPDNWDYYAHGAAFDDFNHQLQAIYDSGDYEIDEDWHAKFRVDVFDACLFALESLVSAGYFEELDCPCRPFVTLGVSDSFEMRDSAPEWVKRLNPEPIVSEFNAWHGIAWRSP